MVSLKASLRAEEVRFLLAGVSDAYRAVVRASQEAVIDLDQFPGECCRRELEKAAENTDEFLDALRPDLLPDVERTVRHALRTQRDEVRALIAGMAAEHESTLAALEDMLAAVAGSTEEPITAAATDVAELRELLNRSEADVLKTGIRDIAKRLQIHLDAIRQEKKALVVTLRDEIRTLQRRIKDLQADAPALLMRSAFEECAQSAMSSHSFFSIIQVSVRNQSQLERFRGLPFAAAAIEEFGSELLRVMPAQTRIGHWQNGDYFILLPGTYQEAIQRAREIGLLLQRTPKIEPPTSSMHLVAQILTTGFDPQEGAGRLAKKLLQVLAAA